MASIPGTATDFNTITVNGHTYTIQEYQAMQYQQNNGVKDNSSLDKDAFLSLLVTQLEYQDPLSPQDNSEYVAQLAQFSSLEQMTNMVDKLSDVYTLVENIDTSVLVGQLSGMIGKEVQWKTSDGTFEGTVTGVSISDGAPSIVAKITGADGSVSTYKVAVSDLTRVGTTD